jgi:hypothetical protein
LLNPGSQLGLLVLPRSVSGLTTSVFEHRNDDWKRTTARDIRKFETVILNEKVKKGLLKDIKNFLDPRSRKWYSGRGIPY